MATNGLAELFGGRWGLHGGPSGALGCRRVMRFWDDEDDTSVLQRGERWASHRMQLGVVQRAAGREMALAFLHGVWVSEGQGSTYFIDARGSAARTVYCYRGDHELTGVFEDWRWDGEQYVASFRWLDQPIAGYVVLRIEGRDALVGGWWYEQHVPPDQVERLPFVPGINPVRWVRQPNDRVWPDWAVKALEIDEAPPITAEGLASGRRSEPVARTAEDRYHQRIARWTGSRTGGARLAARLGHQGWWLLHNAVAHPLLALTRGRAAVAFHDWTSARLNRTAEAGPSSPPPQVERPLWWWLHNVASHLAIGLAPCPATFRWHDATARRMRVPGWV
ncbi:hypothetical protein [Nannocystis punicea]|uniref:Uncharacterized protein n=1 Tax=Nannocystis punicea TaxID=2995304 RepID=A0ABY7HJD3_9BACT|nr:hypothetical protein [Nannocystis poenicansa]WAS99432.1 hypothetical protein O0S08_25180 [Nannocystis poenicansa]